MNPGSLLSLPIPLFSASPLSFAHASVSSYQTASSLQARKVKPGA